MGGLGHKGMNGGTLLYTDLCACCSDIPCSIGRVLELLHHCLVLLFLFCSSWLLVGWFVVCIFCLLFLLIWVLVGVFFNLFIFFI